MKKKILVLVMFALCLFGLAACEEAVAENGAKGETGAQGKSAYEIAVENGFEGTVQAWLESLKGITGRQGRSGFTGDSGTNGTNATELTVFVKDGAVYSQLLDKNGELVGEPTLLWVFEEVEEEELSVAVFGNITKEFLADLTNATGAEEPIKASGIYKALTADCDNNSCTTTLAAMPQWLWLVQFVLDSNPADNKRIKGAANELGLNFEYLGSSTPALDKYSNQFLANWIHNFFNGIKDNLHSGSSSTYPAADFTDASKYVGFVDAMKEAKVYEYFANYEFINNLIDAFLAEVSEALESEVTREGFFKQFNKSYNVCDQQFMGVNGTATCGLCAAHPELVAKWGKLFEFACAQEDSYRDTALKAHGLTPFGSSFKSFAADTNDNKYVNRYFIGALASFMNHNQTDVDSNSHAPKSFADRSSYTGFVDAMKECGLYDLYAQEGLMEELTEGFLADLAVATSAAEPIAVDKIYAALTTDCDNNSCTTALKAMPQWLWLVQFILNSNPADNKRIKGAANDLGLEFEYLGSSTPALDKYSNQFLANWIHNFFNRIKDNLHSGSSSTYPAADFSTPALYAGLIDYMKEAKTYDFYTSQDIIAKLEEGFLADLSTVAGSEVTVDKIYATLAANDSENGCVTTLKAMPQWLWLVQFILNANPADNKRIKGIATELGLEFEYLGSSTPAVDKYSNQFLANWIHNFFNGSKENLHSGSSSSYPAADFTSAAKYNGLIAYMKEVGVYDFYAYGDLIDSIAEGFTAALAVATSSEEPIAVSGIYKALTTDCDNNSCTTALKAMPQWLWVVQFVLDSNPADNKRIKGAANDLGLEFEYLGSSTPALDKYSNQFLANWIHNFFNGIKDNLHSGSSSTYPAADFTSAAKYAGLVDSMKESGVYVQFGIVYGAE